MYASAQFIVPQNWGWILCRPWFWYHLQWSYLIPTEWHQLQHVPCIRRHWLSDSLKYSRSIDDCREPKWHQCKQIVYASVELRLSTLKPAFTPNSSRGVASRSVDSRRRVNDPENQSNLISTRRVRCERSLEWTLVWFGALTRVDALGVNGALGQFGYIFTWIFSTQIHVGGWLCKFEPIETKEIVDIKIHNVCDFMR